MLSATPSGCRLMLTFNLSKTSAEPHFDDSDFTFICRAQLYTQQGKYKEAAQDYQKIINAKQNSKHSLHAQLAIAQLSALHI